LFWLELLIAARLVEPNVVAPLLAECTELVKIPSASLATAKVNRNSLIIQSLNELKL
jgi:hypothetical protein